MRSTVRVMADSSQPPPPPLPHTPTPTPPPPPPPPPSPPQPSSAAPVEKPAGKPRRPAPSGCGKCGYSFAGHSLPPERCPECGWDARAGEELDEQPAPDPRTAITPGVIGCGLVWVGIFACALALAFTNALLFTVPIVWIGAILCVYGLVRPRGERLRFPLLIALGVVAVIGIITWPAMIYPVVWLRSVLFP